MTTGRALAKIIWTLAIASCGGEPARPVAPVAPPTSAPPAIEAEPAPDLSPVPEPKALLLVGRFDPEFVALLFNRSAEDFPYSAFREIGATVPPGLQEYLARSAPCEVAIAIDEPESLLARGPDVVMSVGLTSFADAARFLRSREGDGDIAVERRKGGAYAINQSGSDKARCWLFPSVGATPARFVCGSSPAAVESLGPYVTRTLPTRSLGDAPVVFEATPKRVHDAHGDALERASRFILPLLNTGPRRSPADGFAEASAPTLLAETFALLSDIERARFVAARGPNGLGLTLKIDLVGKRAWTTRALRSMAARGDGAREMFAKLPAETDFAWFSSGPDPARTDEARGALKQWLRAMFGPTTSDETIDLIVRTFLQRSPAIYAQGDASGVDSTGRQSGRDLWQKTMSTFGWHIVGFDEPSKEYLPKLDLGMKNYNAGGLRDLAYAQLPHLCRGLAKITKRPFVARGIPAGSVIYEMKFPGKFFDDCMKRHSRGPKDPAPNDALVVIMVPDGNRTWVGFGPLAVMTKRMSALVGPGTDPTLGGAAELAPLRDKNVKLGGFSTFAGWGGLLRFLSMQERWGLMRSDFGRLPNKGNTRVPFWLEIPADEKAPITARIDVPQAALDDLTAKASRSYGL